MIAIVAACSTNRVIGRDGTLPWSLPSDLRHFRGLTVGSTVVMGRRTFESLPDAARPLPGRRNLVLTTNPDWRAPGVEAFGDLDAALDACGRDAFVIGGERVFREALGCADRVHLTEVDVVTEGDAFFPELDGRWACVEESEPIVEAGLSFTFRVYE